jgi:hypothetical protein
MTIPKDSEKRLRQAAKPVYMHMSWCPFYRICTCLCGKEPFYSPFSRKIRGEIPMSESGQKLDPETELKFLRYFYMRVRPSLGPADSEIIDSIKEEFTKKTGKAIPKDY